MKPNRPIRIVSEEELGNISQAFGYDSASTHGWATKRLYEFKTIVEEGGIIDIPFEYGRLPPQRLDSLASYMNWQNEVWGRYLI